MSEMEYLISPSLLGVGDAIVRGDATGDNFIEGYRRACKLRDDLRGRK
jgi:hypothetical protein